MPTQLQLIELLEVCDDKQHAEQRLHDHVATAKAVGAVDMGYRVKVIYRKGWGVWLTRRT